VYQILFVTGGTGGHIFPALAVGEHLRKLNIEPLYIVRKNKFDVDLFNQYKFSYLTISASGFFGKKLIDVFNFFTCLIKSIITFPIIMYKVKPEAIVASGGFVSLVPLLWALIVKKKYFLLEQNRIPGRVTKYFSRWAKEVYLGLPPAQKISGNCIYTGNPLRTSFYNIRKVSKKDNNVILVLGGSQGAQFINLNVLKIAKYFSDFTFIIQTGKRNFEEIKKSITLNNCQLIDFTLHPEELYQKAKIVISRAGGMVISEILFFGLPSIIIPFPFATDNHQAANAQFLAQNKAAITINQNRQHGLSNNFVLQLKHILQSMINHDEILTKMGKNAENIAKKNAAQTIAQRISKCLAE
jgi:UDP-N-acetylglucosamine--N-acetylmuramyl-(pentapeptide) pyrophosphoryl-undecaprenol N-acetylglucosamine transferase